MSTVLIDFKSHGVEFIRNEMDWDKYDAWGSVSAARFDLAEAVWHASSFELGGYEPSLMLIKGRPEEGSRVERLMEAIREDIITLNDVMYWWNILERMYRLVILAEQDY